MEKYLITELEANQRIDKFARKYLNNAPLSMIYKLFRKKDIKVNGKAVKEDYILQKDDEVTFYLPKTNDSFVIEKVYRPSRTSLKIVYEDENILVVSKPTGILVHNAEKKNMTTLADQVLTYLVEKGEFNPKVKGFIPAPAHRLDRNTSGLVVFGKNMEALQELNEAFKERSGLRKFYQVLVMGKVSRAGEVKCLLRKDSNDKMVRVVKSDGLSSHTLYRPLRIGDDYSLLEAELLSGRTHQIRVHMAYINHPVVGDKKYGNFLANSHFHKLYGWDNQFLHAYKLIFTTFSNKLEYLNGLELKDELPEDKKSIILKIFS